MAITAAQPFNAFLDGRQARQQEEYGSTRNKLADLEVQQAPRDIANRNALADRQQQQYSQDQVNRSLEQTAAAAMRIAKSPSPRAELQANREFAANLMKQHPELAQMGDDDLAQYMGWIAGEAQSKLGIAPAQPKTPESFTLSAGQTRYGPNGKPIATAPVSNDMTPYQTERLKIEREKINKPSAADAGPLVQIAGPDGKPIYATRDDAKGKQAYTAPVANQNQEAAKKLGNAKDVQSIIALAEPIIQEATNSYIGAGYDQAARLFGKSTEGGKAASQLKALQAALMLKMPRMEGPQSNLDVQLYREAAGQIGDPTVPKENKLAALKSIKDLQQAYANGATSSQVDQPTQAAQATPKRVKVDANGNVIGN